MIERLPCPFCGVQPTVWAEGAFERDDEQLAGVTCENRDCPAEVRVMAPTMEKAAELWNQRRLWAEGE